MLLISMQKRKSQKHHSKVCLLYVSIVIGFHLFNEFICSMNSCEFTYVCLYELLGVDTMAPKEAKKRMKASEDKKRNLLQTTMGPTSCKTV